MRTTIFLCIQLIHLSIFAQTNVKIIYPKTSFLNQTNDTLYCLPKQKLEILMEREEINKELIAIFENRVKECKTLRRI